MDRLQPEFREQPVAFKSSGNRLHGILHSPKTQYDAGVSVLMVVGGPQTRVGSHRRYVQLARFLAEHGFSVLRFDYPGIGDAEGEWRGYAHAGPAISDALDTLAANKPHTPIVIWSLCDGAAISLVHAAAHNERFSRLILCNPYLHDDAGEAKTMLRYYYLQRLMQKDFWRKLLNLRFDVRASVAGLFGLLQQSQSKEMRVPLRHSVEQDELAPASLASAIENINIPVHFILSTNDLTAKRFRDRCLKGKIARRKLASGVLQMHPVHQADHTFTTQTAKQNLFRITFEILTKVQTGQADQEQKVTHA